MDRYSFEVRHWLDLRYDPARVAITGLPYRPYQPLDGLGEGDWSNGTLSMAGRMARLAADLEQLGARTLLDVGGAEGLVAAVARQVAGVDAVSCDLSLCASQRARERFGLPALAAEAHCLPFPDASFDVVYCGEVVEHLARPLESLREFLRVARLAVIVTSEEAVFDEGERTRELEERRLAAHMDRSILCPQDLPLVLPELDWRLSNQLARPPFDCPQGAGPVGERLRADLRTPRDRFDGFGLYALGRTAAARSGDASDPDPRAVVAALAPGGCPGGEPAPMPVPFTCPACRGALDGPRPDGDQRLTCPGCDRGFDLHGGVADLTLGLDDDPGPTLEERLPGSLDAQRRAAILELDRRFEVPLPSPVSEDRLPLDVTRWSPGPETRLEADEAGLLVESSADDPSLVSPRLCRPLPSIARLRVRLEVFETRADTERLQVYFKTLHWPLFWEGASVSASYPSAPGVHEFELPASDPSFFRADDELIELRIDPSDGPSRIRLLGVELLPPTS